MLWSLGRQVARGVIDNRVEGRVYGHLWIVGSDAPVTFCLTGNAGGKLVGQRTEFVNTSPKAEGKFARLRRVQFGAVINITIPKEWELEDETPPATPGELALEYESTPSNRLHLEWENPEQGKIIVDLTTYAIARQTNRPVWWMRVDDSQLDLATIETEESAARFIRRFDWIYNRFMMRLSKSFDFNFGLEEFEPFLEEACDYVRTKHQLPHASHHDIAELDSHIAQAKEMIFDSMSDWISCEAMQDTHSAKASIDIEQLLRRERGHTLTPHPHKNALKEFSDLVDKTIKPPDNKRPSHPEDALTVFGDDVRIALSSLHDAFTGFSAWPPSLFGAAHRIAYLQKAKTSLDCALIALDALRKTRRLDALTLDAYEEKLTVLAKENARLVSELRALFENASA